MYDVSKETNVRFLRAAVQLLQEKLLIEKRVNLALMEAKALDDELCSKLSDELLVLRRRFFAGGRERSPRNGADRRSKSRKRLLHNEPPIEADDATPIELDTDEVIHTGDVPTCTCGCQMAPMVGGFEESTEIDVTERRYTLRRHKRQKFVCRGCKKIVAADGPVKLTPGGSFSLQMAAQVADDKFSQHLPLNRQVEQMARSGLRVGSRTLYGMTEHLASRLAAVPALIRSEIHARPYVSIDESPVKLLADNQSGYVWSISNNHGIYYQYEPTRSGKVAREMLSGFAGIVMSDGFAGYDFLDKSPGIKLVSCWSHLRRMFFDAKAKYPEAKPAIAMIDELYDIEREATNFTELTMLRNTRSREVVARFEAYLDSRRNKFLASSTFGKAVNYYDERDERFRRFLDDANAPLDNNGAERAQRAPVIGRNNFQGYRTINGADTAMTFYTIIGTCKLLCLPAKAYMTTMAIRAANGDPIVTPYRWATELAGRAKAQDSANEVMNAVH